MRSVFLLALLFATAPLAGCLEQNILGDVSRDWCEGEVLERESDGTLRVLTYDIAAFSNEMLAEFTNQSGYEVELIRTDDAGGILEQMLQTQSAPQADLAVGLDNTYLWTAIDRCLLQEHTVNTSSIDATALEPYDGPLAVPFDRGDVCLNYDERVVDGTNLSAPTSLWNLTEEAWRGKVAFPSPLTSSPGRAFMLATVDYFGADQDNTTNAIDWWRAMAQNDAVFTSGWTEAYEIHYSGGYGAWVEGHLGDAAMTVSYCHSPGVEAFYGDNWTASTSLTLPRSTFHQVDYGAVIAGAGEVNAANAFLAYLISEDVNRNMPENNLMGSVLTNASWPSTNGYAYHTDVPEQNAMLALSDMGTEIDLWLNLWAEATQ